MSDNVKVQLITSRFGKMLEDFAAIDPKVEFRDIVIGVAIRVIAGALRRTKAADPRRIRDGHAGATFTTMDGKIYKLSNYFHNESIWNRIEQKRRAALDTKLAARGLSKQSWLHQARQLGATLEVPAYVANANFKGQQHPENAAHMETGAGGQFALKIINSSPIVQAANGRFALIAAMSAETRYFYTLLARGGFATAATRAAKYPGVYVRPLALPA